MLKEKNKLWLWVVAAGAGAMALVGILLALLLPHRPVEAPALPSQTTAATQPGETGSPPEKFAYQGAYLTCLTQPSVLGIDVSSHRGQIDWEQVSDAGIRFAMLRLGYRGTDLGGIYEDEWFARNYEGARAAGLQVGAYFFSQAITPEEAAQEAAFALQLLTDRPLDMPLVYDWEDTGPESRVAGMDADTLTQCTLTFCRSVAEAGYRAMVYSNPTQARSLLHMEQLSEYEFWLAMYSEDMTFEYPVDMWQYTCTGVVPGIAGDVDINLYFPPEEES